MVKVYAKSGALLETFPESSTVIEQFIFSEDRKFMPIKYSVIGNDYNVIREFSHDVNVSCENIVLRKLENSREPTKKKRKAMSDASSKAVVTKLVEGEN